MIIKNSPPTKRSNQAKNTEPIKYSHKESFKRENKSILDDSDLIKNYNESLKSPQSMRIYKTLENEIHHISIGVQELLPLDKISI